MYFSVSDFIMTQKTFKSSIILIDSTNKAYVKTGTSVAEPNTVVYYFPFFFLKIDS
jgi:hypothetical protein